MSTHMNKILPSVGSSPSTASSADMQPSESLKRLHEHDSDNECASPSTKRFKATATSPELEAGCAQEQTTSDPDFSSITILEYAVVAPQPEEPSSRWKLIKMPTWGRKYNVVDTIVLNDEGSITVLVRGNTTTTDKKDADKPAVIEVKCSLLTIRSMSTSEEWNELFPNTLKKGSKVDMLHEDPCAVLFALRAAHDKGKYLPTELVLPRVYKVASLIHTYDIVGKVRQITLGRMEPWLIFEYLSQKQEDLRAVAENLTAEETEEFNSIDTRFFLDLGNEQWLFIAWVFGLKHTCKALLVHLVRTCKLNAAGELCNEKGDSIRGMFPTVLLDHIMMARSSYLQKLLDFTYDHVDDLLDPKYVLKKNAVKTAYECGAFLRGLTDPAIRLTPYKPNVDTLKHLSVQKLENHLKLIKRKEPIAFPQESAPDQGAVEIYRAEEAYPMDLDLDRMFQEGDQEGSATSEKDEDLGINGFWDTAIERKTRALETMHAPFDDYLQAQAAKAI